MTLRETALRAIGETRWVPASGENRIRGMVVGQARLGDEPPARLGRADRRVRQEGRARAADRRARQRSASPKPSSAKAPTPGTRRAPRSAFSRPTTIPPTTKRSTTSSTSGSIPGSTHSYVLEDPVHFPGLAGIQRKSRRRRRRSDVSRRLRPASRLVPILAARKLRHARARAVRRRADARLHARREGPQDVEVAGQPDLPAGRHQAARAPTSCGCGSPASTIPTISASARKS